MINLPIFPGLFSILLEQQQIIFYLKTAFSAQAAFQKNKADWRSGMVTHKPESLRLKTV